MVLYDKTTLVVRHLPHELTRADKVDLLKFFGAEDVKTLDSDFKKSSLVFATFDKEYKAESALKKLHQADIMGQLISVEFARGKQLSEAASSVITSDVGNQGDNRTQQRKLMEDHIVKLNSWCNVFDFNLPPPSHLKYSYPPPTLVVLRNICKALAKVPKLYTQVLHLMNRMNLPCPFVEDYIIKDETTDLIPNVFKEGSDDESEMESESESGVSSIKPAFEKQKKPKLKRPYKLVRPTVVKKPKLEKKIDPGEVFETVKSSTKKIIELQIPSDLTAASEPTDLPQSEGFEKMHFSQSIDVPSDLGENSQTDEEHGTIISDKELYSNRVPPQEIHHLPIFKNYHPGVASCRLYIKNLAKTVQLSDLNRIYRRYLSEEVDDQGSMFDIRLMQEGRMKGQAFVTFQSVSLAEKALKETNGYKLKGKPMVVQFARSQKPK